MEVDSKIHPFLSYVLSRRPLRQPLKLSSKPSFSSAIKVDFEANEPHGEALLKEMPMLREPKPVAKMTAAVSDVAQTRSVLESLGERPDYEAVDEARRRVAEIERELSRRLEEIFAVKTPEGSEWRSLQVQKEKDACAAAEKAKLPHKTVVQLYDMHVAYGDLLQEAEERLVKIYRAAESGSEIVDWTDEADDEMDEEVAQILQEASKKPIDRVELTGRRLHIFPEGFCKITTLVSVHLSDNKIQLMRPQLEEVTEQMKECVDPKGLEEGQRRVKNLFKQYNVTPFTPMKGILIQGPVFISFYLAITNMAANVPSFKEGGALWFQDLSTPDSLYLLPALTALSFLATVELNMQEGLEGNPMANKMKLFSRFIALITVPITMHFPKAIFCYWITSNLFSLVHGAVIKMPGVKRALAIPEIPVPAKAPTTLAGSITTTEKGPPSSSLVHQRMRALERTVKARRLGKKR